ncbi:MAG: ABC transporter permease [Dehalococcoidia bacterium]|nr:ABC transporter permease [Dehalococcoidia bacterium]
MELHRLVAKDVMRRKRRVLYAVLGVVIGIMTVISILTVALAAESRIYEQLEEYGANLVVIPAVSQLDLELGGLGLGSLTVGQNYIPEGKVSLVRQITDDMINHSLGIQDERDRYAAPVSPKLYVSSEVRGVSVMVVGIDPEEERRMKTWWRIREGEYLDGTDQALLGALAAELLELNAGDSIVLNGFDMTVAGILRETGSNDDYQIFVPIRMAQEAVDREGMVSSIDVRALCIACPVEDIADEINMMVPGVRAVAVKQIAMTEMGMMDRINRFMLALAGITLAVGMFGVVNTMTTSVHERIRDIGIMRAVGASRNQIVRTFIYEAIIVGILGGVLGFLAGTLLAYGIGPLIFPGVSVGYVPGYLPLSLALAIVVAVAATLYPAFRATRIRVADSFRSL